MVNQDRYGLFRPTADGDGKMIHAEWATYTNVHIDVSGIYRYSICFPNMKKVVAQCAWGDTCP